MIFVAGITLWLGSMLVQTGLGGIVALWTAALVLGGLLVVTLPARTVTIGQVVEPLCLGGAMLGVAILIGAIFDAMFGAGASRARDIGIPLIEEVLKILPLLWLLWRDRDDRTQTLGVTDVLLIATACGLGFGLVEDAFMRHRTGGRWATLWWLPTTIVTSSRRGTQLIAGHDPWTALAGLTIGFALLLRRPRLQMILIAASGLLWAVIDHVGNNYGIHYRDGLATTLRFVTGDGWVTAYLLLFGIFAAVVYDFYLVNLVQPRLPEGKLPRPTLSLDGLRTFWAFERVRRQFAYAVARYQRETGMARARLAVLAANLDMALVNWQQWWREAAHAGKA
jgi:RsiW-degrading membrane proteinase PrsW (M82 family)